MTAIVLAGDRTKADSLINHTKAGSKAMIDLDGTPMVRRVLNSLRQSKVVHRICIAGPEARVKVLKDVSPEARTYLFEMETSVV